MATFFHKATLAAALVATVGLTAAPAEARDRYYRHRGGGDDAAIAIGAGLVGLALGAAIASDRRDRYYDGYYNYDRRYYPRGYYNGYRAYPRYNHPYRQRYYRDRYYRDRPYGYGYGYRR
jgi:hypothetical protein